MFFLRLRISSKFSGFSHKQDKAVLTDVSNESAHIMSILTQVCKHKKKSNYTDIVHLKT